MNLKELADVVEGLRARGVHPMTEVIIRDGVSTLAVDAVELDRSAVVITPFYIPETVSGAVAEDDE